VRSIIIDSISKNKILEILSQNLEAATKVYAFGSRVKGTDKQFADFDIAISAPQPLPQFTIDKLNIAFENSTIPFKIDVIDLNNIEKDFLEAISEDLTLFYEK